MMSLKTQSSYLASRRLGQSWLALIRRCSSACLISLSWLASVGVRSNYAPVRWSCTILKKWCASALGLASTSQPSRQPGRQRAPYLNKTGNRFYRVRFAREAHRAAIKRQMQTEQRWARGRNTRGLPVGTGEHMRGPDLTAKLNAQSTHRRARLPKLVRRIAALCGTFPSATFRLQLPPSPLSVRRAAAGTISE